MSDDTHIYERQGFGARLGFGRAPALLVIDFINAFNDAALFGGGNIQSAIDHTVGLLALARDHAIPVVFTTNVYAADGSEDGAFTMKVPGLRSIHPGGHSAQVVDALAPRAGERLIEKRYASGFFSTDLSAWLAHRGVDTAIVTGCTTSGCVRATVVDAVSYGFRPIVPRECVGDRALAPHDASLFDMDQQYADVMVLDEVCAQIRELCPPTEAAGHRARRA